MEEPKSHGVAKSAPVLPWMRVPITIKPGDGVALQHVAGLDQRLLAALQKGLNFRELFPVQSVVWAELSGGASTAHDLCIAAPTGSGKTLAYSLPVVNALARPKQSGSLHCLQALVVLPTRDLAAQVYQVFAALCPAVGLTVGLAAAKSTLAAEAAALLGPLGCELSSVDVLVATPGRLMAHLHTTPGFTLRHLRFLVVDETDRLLRQSYQEWLPQVLTQLQQKHFSNTWAMCTGASQDLPCAQARAVKLIVSATLTRDPSKLQRLDLHCPRYVATSANDHRYHLPRNLEEFKVLSSAQRKPLVLLALLDELQGQATVIFTSSLDTTHKCYLMLEAALGHGHNVVEFSSHLTSQQRARALERFRSGQAKVLVASDAMTRGMDVENVQNVINYDAPVYAKTYVHRAGRTARAGRAGRVYTLLRDEDVRHFKSMLRKADNTYVKDYKPTPERVEATRPRLEAALQQVQELLAAESAQDAAVKGQQKGSQTAERRLPSNQQEQEQEEQTGPGAKVQAQTAEPDQHAGKSRKHHQDEHEIEHSVQKKGKSKPGG